MRQASDQQRLTQVLVEGLETDVAEHDAEIIDLTEKEAAARTVKRLPEHSGVTRADLLR